MVLCLIAAILALFLGIKLSRVFATREALLLVPIFTILVSGIIITASYTYINIYSPKIAKYESKKVTLERLDTKYYLLRDDLRDGEGNNYQKFTYSRMSRIGVKSEDINTDNDNFVQVRENKVSEKPYLVITTKKEKIFYEPNPWVTFRFSKCFSDWIVSKKDYEFHIPRKSMKIL